MHFTLSEEDEPANGNGDELGGAVGYLYLTKHPGPGTGGCVAKQIRLLDVIAGYKGADVYLDFDKSGELIGIEILED